MRQAVPKFWRPKHFSVTSVTLFFLNLFAASCTFAGLYDFIQANYTVDRNISLLGAFAAAVIIQLILYVCLIAIVSPRLSLLWHLLALPFYALTLSLTVGFGFGFFWKAWNASFETLRSAETSQTIANNTLSEGQNLLAGIRARFDDLEVYSRNQRDEERAHGKTCGPSGAEVGPRYELRNRDADTFAGMKNTVNTMLQKVTNEINDVRSDFVKLSQNDSATIDPLTKNHGPFVSQLNQKLNVAVQNLNGLRSNSDIGRVQTGDADAR